MADKELTGKVAIVTGAGRNIGRAIALALAGSGASVVVNARSNRAEAEAVAREIETPGSKALVHVGDVADPAAVQAMADAAVRAALRGQPYIIPPEQFERCRDMVLRFNPRDMYGG